VANLIEMEELSGAVPTSRDPDKLRRDGFDHWKRGDIGRGLAHLMALRELAPTDEASRATRQEAILDFSIAAVGLGRLLIAREILSDLLCEPIDPKLVTRVLLQAATVWTLSGARHAAMGFLREAEAQADRSDVAFASPRRGATRCRGSGWRAPRARSRPVTATEGSPAWRSSARAASTSRPGSLSPRSPRSAPPFKNSPDWVTRTDGSWRITGCR